MMTIGNERIVIVGGDAAGMSAASRLARLGMAKNLTVFERSETVSYAACGMPYHLDGRIPDRNTLLIRSAAQFNASGIDVRTGHEAISVDTKNQRITVTAGSRQVSEPFDKLLVATGARASVPPLRGRDAPNVFTFRSFADLERVTHYLERERPKRAAVMGGGYIGVELAEVLTCRGIAVTLFESESHVLPVTLDPEMASLVMEEMSQRGVTLKLGERVQSLELGQDGRVKELVTPSGGYACDLVLMCTGVRPATDLLKDTDIVLDEKTGAIWTDERLKTSHPAVWAAGDCADLVHVVTGQRAWIPLGPAANKQGRLAANSIAGHPVDYKGAAGTAFVKAFELEVGRTGLSRRQAEAAGIELESVTISAPDVAHYYPGSEETTVTLHSERASGRLVGAQIIGRAGVAGRANVVATALHARMTVADLADVDLGYAPPFAPVWDPLLVAAGRFAR